MSASMNLFSKMYIQVKLASIIWWWNFVDEQIFFDYNDAVIKRTIVGFWKLPVFFLYYAQKYIAVLLKERIEIW